VPAADHSTDQTGLREHEDWARQGNWVRARPQRDEELTVDRVAVVEKRYLSVRAEDRTQPVPHLVDGSSYLTGRGLARCPEQIHNIEEVSEHLAVIGRRALVVAAVSQNLSSQLPGQPPQRQPQEPLIGEENGKASQGLESFDQVVAADVVLEVPTQKSRMSREPGDEIRFYVAPGCEVMVQTAP
jgi:hypothetical protein